MMSLVAAAEAAAVLVELLTVTAVDVSAAALPRAVTAVLVPADVCAEAAEDPEEARVDDDGGVVVVTLAPEAVDVPVRWN